MKAEHSIGETWCIMIIDCHLVVFEVHSQYCMCFNLYFKIRNLSFIFKCYTTFVEESNINETFPIRVEHKTHENHCYRWIFKFLLADKLR